MGIFHRLSMFEPLGRERQPCRASQAGTSLSRSLPDHEIFAAVAPGSRRLGLGRPENPVVWCVGVATLTEAHDALGGHAELRVEHRVCPSIVPLVHDVVLERSVASRRVMALNDQSASAERYASAVGRVRRGRLVYRHRTLETATVLGGAAPGNPRQTGDSIREVPTLALECGDGLWPRSRWWWRLVGGWTVRADRRAPTVVGDVAGRVGLARRHDARKHDGDGKRIEREGRWHGGSMLQ